MTRLSRSCGQWFFFVKEAFPPLFVNSVVGFTLFTTYTLTESTLRYLPSDVMPSYYVPAVAGATAGAAQAVISHPLDNVRAVLAAQTLKNGKTVHREWKGWRHVAFRALFPQWLTTTTSAKLAPFRFAANWMRSTSSLLVFTLMRDSIGFAVFFTIFELSRTFAKRAGKAVDRWQAAFRQRSRETIGVDLLYMLDNDMLPRGWSGRVVQAIVIVGCGVFAGIGYGIFSRPFDKARTVVWDGLEVWAKDRKAEQQEAERAQAAQERAGKPKSAVENGSPSIVAVPSKSSKAAAHAIPSLISHRSRHSRFTAHETRLPLHPPRLAEPPKHPLKKPSTLHAGRTTPSIPSSLQLLREATKREGVLAMLGFSSAATGALSSIAPSMSVLSRRQLALGKGRSSLSKNSGKTSGRTLSIESLAEHPALGGASVFDNLPDPADKSLLKTSHRKPRWFHRGAPLHPTAKKPFISRLRSNLSISSVFRIIPPYCFGFLAYSIIANDFGD